MIRIRDEGPYVILPFMRDPAYTAEPIAYQTNRCVSPRAQDHLREIERSLDGPMTLIAGYIGHTTYQNIIQPKNSQL